MKLKNLAAVVLSISLVAVSCDDTTDNIGQSLTDNMDRIKIYTDTFNVSTRSIKADAVLSRTTTGTLGRIVDPETGTQITGDITTTFHVIEDGNTLKKDSLACYQNEGKIYADSCVLRFFVASALGDSLATMKSTLYELSKPLLESEKTYTDFDPLKEGFIRTDENAIKIAKTYTTKDFTIDKSTRESSSYVPYIHIALNGPYTDKNGKTYSNYGTYILQMLFDHPEYFKNSVTFANKVCPGFYLKTESGLGSMAYISISNLSVYYRIQPKEGQIYTSYMNFSGTEEVKQHTTIKNDEKIADLINDNSCTYLKTPAGIFTELTLPVEDIMSNHIGDTLNTAKIKIQRINSSVENEYALKSPSNLLMVQKDSLYSFFDKAQIPDDKKSFVSSLSSNTYTFSNISSLIRDMYKIKVSGKASEDWNKVVLVPVEVTKSSINNVATVVKVNHDMSVTSTRLVGGSENPYDDIKISIIYSKFSGE